VCTLAAAAFAVQGLSQATGYVAQRASAKTARESIVDSAGRAYQSVRDRTAAERIASATETDRLSLDALMALGDQAASAAGSNVGGPVLALLQRDVGRQLAEGRARIAQNQALAERDAAVRIENIRGQAASALAAHGTMPSILGPLLGIASAGVQGQLAYQQSGGRNGFLGLGGQQ
jgi:hypothetical protein